MSSPTTRASNVWQTEAADDMLQINTPRGPVISGIDSNGAGFGALASGPTITFSTGPEVFAIPGGVTDLQVLPGPGPRSFYTAHSILAVYTQGTRVYTNPTEPSGVLYIGPSGNNQILISNLTYEGIQQSPFVPGNTVSLYFQSTAVGAGVNPNQILNQPMTITLPACNGSPITGLTINQPGTGFAIGDPCVVNDGAEDNLITITSVDGGGGVTGFTINDPGTGNVPQTNTFAFPNSGGGSGFTVDVAANLPGNGVVTWTVSYAIITI